MKTRLICVFIIVLITTNTVFARDEDDPITPWAIEERCVLEAVSPPDDWTYEGTIIANGWAGIHGMNAGWETPRVLAFNDGWIGSGGYGTLSPNGRWYAVPHATYRRDTDLFSGFIDVTRLLIYDMTNRQNILRLDWEDSYYYFVGSGYTRQKNSRSPVWFDEDTIIYQRGEMFYYVHVPELEVELWADPSEWTEISPVQVGLMFPSPDWTRIIDIDTSGLFDTNTNTFIADVNYPPPTTYAYPSVAWHPSSNEFVISNSLSTTSFDADGNLLDVVSLGSNGENNNTFVWENSYSNDGIHFGLNYNANVSGRSYLYTIAIANRLERTITDTCIRTPTSITFSPDGRYLALLNAVYAQQQELQIFDIENWALYNTGIYHQGRIIGWRNNE